MKEECGKQENEECGKPVKVVGGKQENEECGKPLKEECEVDKDKYGEQGGVYAMRIRENCAK